MIEKLFFILTVSFISTAIVCLFNGNPDVSVAIMSGMGEDGNGMGKTCKYRY